MTATTPMAADAAQETVTVLGYPVWNRGLDAIPISRPARVIATISPNSYGMATQQPDLRQALRAADYLVLDGVYFGLGAILLEGRRVRINNGPSVFAHFMQRLNDTGGRAFFLGSTAETLSKMKSRASQDYPRVSTATYSPPFVKEFSADDDRAMIDAINAFKPDVVFVGMTAPKQELWAYRNRPSADAGLIASVGAVFDWFAGNESEIAPIWWKLHLGWLIRTIRRPEILRRYPSIFIFFRDLAIALVKLK